VWVNEEYLIEISIASRVRRRGNSGVCLSRRLCA
jgi:hypothetical protein